MWPAVASAWASTLVVTGVLAGSTRLLIAALALLLLSTCAALVRLHAREDHMSDTIDLDAKRAEREAARREAKPKALPTVVFGGENFTLPEGSLPGEVLIAIGHLQQGRLYGMEEALRALLGDEPPTDEDGEVLRDDDDTPVRSPYERFMGHKPTQDDLQDFLSAASAAYGESRGKSRGSQASSNGTTRPPKRTSPTSTPE